MAEQNAYLQQIYQSLVNTQQEKIQIDVQKTVAQQAANSSMMKVNLGLLILFYVCCLLLAGLLFYLSKSAAIKTMSNYMKVAILVVAVMYPLWISMIDQIVVFIIRYMSSLILGVPYTKNIRQ